MKLAFGLALDVVNGLLCLVSRNILAVLNNILHLQWIQSTCLLLRRSQVTAEQLLHYWLSKVFLSRRDGSKGLNVAILQLLYLI